MAEKQDTKVSKSKGKKSAKKRAAKKGTQRKSKNKKSTEDEQDTAAKKKRGNGDKKRSPSSKKRNRVARVNMDGTVAVVEVEEKKDSPTKSKALSKKERKKKRKEKYRQGPPSQMNMFHNSLTSLSKSVIDTLYGGEEQSGKAKKQKGARRESNLEDIAELGESPTQGDVDDSSELLEAASNALHAYQLSHASSDDLDEFEDLEEPEDARHRNAGELEGAEPAGLGRRSGHSRGRTSTALGRRISEADLDQDNEDLFIVKQFKRISSRVKLRGSRRSLDADGSQHTNGVGNNFPPSQIQVDDMEMSAISTDITMDRSAENKRQQSINSSGGMTNSLGELAKASRGSKQENGLLGDDPDEESNTVDQTSTSRAMDDEAMNQRQSLVSSTYSKDADIMSEDPPNRCGPFTGLFGLVVTGFTVGCCVWILTILGVIGPGDSFESEDLTVAPTPSPSAAPSHPSQPTSSPTMSRHELVERAVRDEFGEASFAALRVPGSPQSDAANWIDLRDGTFTFPLSGDERTRETFRQRYALAVFYFATGATGSWEDDYGFLSASHECDWRSVEADENGVVCDEDLLVTRLDIPSNGLTGTLPDELFVLSHLTSLSLPYNPISGSLNPLVGNLKNLALLWMEGSKLTGGIPGEVANAVSLESINMADNSIEGTLPNGLRLLTNLRSLKLGNNFIGGTIPQRLTSLPKLEEFDVSLNKITGKLPTGSSSSLQVFSVESNRLTGPLSNFELVRSLDLLFLQKNKFTGELPSDWDIARDVTKIDLSHNLLGGPIPNSLGSLSRLQLFAAANCGLTGTLPSALQYTPLEVIELEGNRLHGTVPAGYSRLPLSYFSIGKNSITGDLTNSVCTIPTVETVLADCPSEITCPCCSQCLGKDNANVKNIFANS